MYQIQVPFQLDTTSYVMVLLNNLHFPLKALNFKGIFSFRLKANGEMMGSLSRKKVLISF